MLKKRLAAAVLAGGSLLGAAAAAPAEAHDDGSLVDIEIEDNQLVLLSGITVSTAANVCGIQVNAVLAAFNDQDVTCDALSRPNQRVVIRQHN
jgi:hypothetical protein